MSDRQSEGGARVLVVPWPPDEDPVGRKLDNIALELRREIDIRTLECGRSAEIDRGIRALRWALDLVEAEYE